jgi:hypothetical protein
MKTTLIKPLVFDAGTSERQKHQKLLMKLSGTAVAVLLLVISVSSVRSGRIDFGGVVPATHVAGEFAPGTDNAVPDGLTAADWNSIRVAHEAQRNVVIPNANGYRAHNPGQQWQTQFDGCGFLIQPEKGDWRWGLGLHSYGFPGHEQTVGRPQSTKADGQRVTYGWEDNLSEWFVNDSRGLEHGFTVARRPGGSETKAPLKLAFSVAGNLRPVISSDGSGVRFVNEAGASILTYTELKVWDADGRTLPARFVATEQAFALSVDEQGARYPITIDPTAQQAYLKASNTEAVAFPSTANDYFGSAVAISGDTVVVGAPNEASAATGVNGNQADNSAEGSGAAYVFVRSGSTWTQQAYLKASNTGAGDFFGDRVAISGDTVVVGALSEASATTGVNGNQSDNSAANAGAAYIFVRSGNTWSQQAYVKASNTGTFDVFGSSVAISGDTVVIGALGEASAATGVNGNQADNSFRGAGAAYIFVRSGSAWSQQAYLKASNTCTFETFDVFGSSVAISGDTVVVGAPDEDSAATGVNGNQADYIAQGSGAAYVFVRSGSTWTQQAYLKASNTEANDGFATSVAISGNTVVVGAIGEASAATGVNGNQSDNSAFGAGAAYVFVRNGSTWSQQAYVKASNAGMYDGFGGSVAISGDTVVVGAEREDSAATGVNGNQAANSAEGAGAAYAFVRSGSTWTQQAYLKASNTQTEDIFGRSVAISGDTVVVATPVEASAATGVNGNQSDNSAPNAGAAYIFAGAAAPLQNISTRASVQTGQEVTIAGFIISGAGSKSVVVRGLGPTLSQPPFNITGVLADPTLQLFDGSGHPFWFNDNWKDTQQAQIQATGFAPPNDFESAILQVLQPGNYTAILSGKNGTTGVGLVEVYDISPGVSAELTNVSTRGFVGTDQSVLIAGFITGGGNGSTQVMVRGLGPTLAQPQFGLSGTLADPWVTLLDSNGNVVRTNNDWKNTQQAEISATGKAPPNDLEAAVLATVPAGNYTAILSGNGGGTGIGLVEVYKLP